MYYLAVWQFQLVYQVLFSSCIVLSLKLWFLLTATEKQTRNAISLDFRMPIEIFKFLLLQNYLLGKKETSEMADRNKEVLLEVRMSNQKGYSGHFEAWRQTAKGCGDWNWRTELNVILEDCEWNVLYLR